MSEHNAEPAFGTPDEPSRRPRTLLLAGAGGFVAAALVAQLLLGGGGEEADLAFVPVRPATVTAEVAPPGEVVPATYTGVVGKDPFAPLVTPPAPVSAPEPDPVPVQETAPPPVPVVVTVAPAPAAAPAPAPAAAPAVAPVPAPVTPSAVTVRLSQADPATRRATLTLDGALYEVGIGTVFAQRFVLQDVTPAGCGTFAHGEEPFTLCAGEERAF